MTIQSTRVVPTSIYQLTWTEGGEVGRYLNFSDMNSLSWISSLMSLGGGWCVVALQQASAAALSASKEGDLRGATQDEVGGLFYCNYRIYIVLRARVVQLYNRVALKRDQAALYHDEGLLPPCLCLQATAACQVMICLEMAFVCCCWVFSRNNLTASTRYSTMLYIYKAGTYTCQK